MLQHRAQKAFVVPKIALSPTPSIRIGIGGRAGYKPACCYLSVSATLCVASQSVHCQPRFQAVDLVHQRPRWSRPLLQQLPRCRLQRRGCLCRCGQRFPCHRRPTFLGSPNPYKVRALASTTRERNLSLFWDSRRRCHLWTPCDAGSDGSSPCASTLAPTDPSAAATTSSDSSARDFAATALPAEEHQCFHSARAAVHHGNSITGS